MLELFPCDASLHGFVKDAGGGPIAGAVLRRGPLEVTSAADGAYTLCMPIGEYSNLEVGAAGYGTLALSLTVTNRVRRDFRLSPEGVIVGRAVRADDGRPVADAVVSIPSSIASNERSAPGSFVPSDGAGARAVTDGDGRFRLAGLVPGRRELDAAAAGLRAQTTEVNVLAGDGGEEITIALEPTATVEGRLVDEAGVPVVGAAVIFFEREGAELSMAERSTAVSQEEGRFVLEGLRPGQYSVDASPFISPKWNARFDVPAAGIKDMTVVVRRNSTISGVVVHAGEPVGGAVVYAKSGGFDRARTDAEGRFRLDAIQPGDHELYADSAQLGAFSRGPTVTVTKGQDVSGVTVELSLAGSVAGVVVDQHGAPVSGALVMFELVGGGDFGQATTAEDGTFKARAMSGGGEYRVAIKASPYSEIGYRPAKGNDFPRIALADGKTAVENVRFEVAVDRLTISGRVVDEQGAPRADVRVEATPGGMLGAPIADAYDVTGADGAFAIENLFADDYGLVARAGDGAEARPAKPVAAGSRNVTLVLTTPGEIEGTLIGFPSTPRVTASSIAAGRFGMAEGLSATTTGTSFRIRGVAPGQYAVTAFWRGIVGDTRDVDVRAGAVTKVALTYRGAGTIEATVVDRDGKPVPRVGCSPFVTMFPGIGGRGSTDEQGKVTLTRVAVGETMVFCHLRDGNVGGRATVNVVADKTATVSIVIAPREEPKARGTIGATFEKVSGNLRVAAIVDGGPAATAGMKVGDIVAGLVYHGEEEVDLPYRQYDGAMFDGMIRYMTPGEELTFKLRRGSETVELEITIAAP